MLEQLMRRFLEKLTEQGYDAQWDGRVAAAPGVNLLVPLEAGGSPLVFIETHLIDLEQGFYALQFTSSLCEKLDDTALAALELASARWNSALSLGCLYFYYEERQFCHRYTWLINSQIPAEETAGQALSVLRFLLTELRKYCTAARKVAAGELQPPPRPAAAPQKSE